ncbi:MAG: class I SAM-dependent methyltransferase [Terriglobales bacterium]
MIDKKAVMPIFLLHENVSLWCKRIGDVPLELRIQNCFRIESIMLKRLSLVVLLLLQLQCITARSQNATTLHSEHRKTSTPYTGDLSVFDSPGRDERLQINRVMDILGIAPGKTVADIGAGSGWFTARASKRVGDTGTVYAIDINPEAIRYISARIRKENLRNVKPILGKPDNPLLPATVNAVLLLKTYHEVARPITLLRNLRSSLAAGARVGVIDRNGDGENHGVARDIVIHEANAAGYQLLEQYDFVKDGMDYFLVFGTK